MSSATAGGAGSGRAVDMSLLRRTVLFLVSFLVALPLSGARKNPSSLSSRILTLGPDARPVPADQVRRQAVKPIPIFPANTLLNTSLQLDTKPSSGAQSRSALITEPGPGVNASPGPWAGPGARSLVLPAQGSSNATSARTDSARSLNSRSVCSSDPTLRQLDAAAYTSVCRVYINLRDNDPTDDYVKFGLCSGAFITSQHVLTAAHCIMDLGGGPTMVLDDNGRYGTVCCGPSADDTFKSCDPDAEFDIINAAYQEGWANGDDTNDGAVLKVARQTRTRRDVGVPLRWGSIIRNPCTKRPFEWGGFPFSDTRLASCAVNWRGIYRYSISKQAPFSCPEPNTGDSIFLRGSTCGGMSGGPLVNRVDNYVVGIISTASNDCVGGRGNVKFSLLAVKQGVGGVYVPGLLEAVP